MRIDSRIAVPMAMLALVAFLAVWRPTGEAMADDSAAAVAAHRDEIYNDPLAPVAGNPQGDVTIVEFFDYNCPYCRQVSSVLEELLATDPNLRIVYKEYPILSDDSTYAARVALAAHRQGKYLDYHRALMLGRNRATEDTVMLIADDVGLDLSQLETDIESPAIDEVLARNHALAEALQIDGTPAFVIGDEVYSGAAELKDFQRVIAAVRNQ